LTELCHLKLVGPVVMPHRVVTCTLAVIQTQPQTDRHTHKQTNKHRHRQSVTLHWTTHSTA